jgi:hypothetical protein
MTIKDITIRLAGRVDTGWQPSNQGCVADVGQLSASGTTQAAAAKALTETVQIVIDHAADRGHLVIHEDGSLTVCAWSLGTVMYEHIRDGKVTGSTTAGWKSTEEAAQDVIRTCGYGPGTVVAL